MRMDASADAKLNKQSVFSYKSFGSSSQLADDSSPSDLSKKHDLIPLKQLVCGSPDVFDCSLSNFRGTEEDCSTQDTPKPVYVVSIIFAIGVTIVLVLQISLGDSLVFIKGVLVSDHERCTVLGQSVLDDRGSSVDAAIVGALCLSVVHPHVSGVGGGGVMLVHDIQKNETRVINFQGTAPKTFREELLHNVSELKAGLQVGVPGMLSGLHQAHSLYGSLSWEDVVSRVADVAREGFNVSHSLADAISKIKGEQLSLHFRDVFIPNGRALSPGSHVRMPSLAGILQAGLSNFYHGNLSQEIEDEVRAQGGVLSRDDLSNYTAEVEQPLEGRYHEFIFQVPPPPSAGTALISALRLLERFPLSENNVTENQTYHWTAEALKAALALASDLKYNSSVAELLSDMWSKSPAEVLRQRMNSFYTTPSDYYSTIVSLQTELMAGQVVVMGADNLVVSFASSLSRPFGSRIVTRSGVILNSLMLDFSWTNKGQLPTNQKLSVEPGKRPLLSLMPTIMVPARHKCETYMALSSSGGQNHLGEITQMLVSALLFQKEKNDSLSLRRLHPQLDPDRLLVDSEFPRKSVQFLHAKGPEVQRVKTKSEVQGIQRNKDIIKAIQVPQMPDNLLYNCSHGHSF